MLGNRPEDLIGVRAQRFKAVLQKTLDEAIAEGIPNNHPLVSSMILQIDCLNYVLGQQGTNTEAFIIEGERLIANAGNN